MWLVYLRFKGNGAGKTYHVSAENKRRVDKIVAMAQMPVAVGMAGVGHSTALGAEWEYYSSCSFFRTCESTIL